MNVDLEKYEVAALIKYHRESQWECSSKEEYFDAGEHKKRADELNKMIEEGV